jgi:hypothetical protein
MSRPAGIVVLSALLVAMLTPPAHAALFTNPAPIDVPGCVEGDCSAGGAGAPYPSTIDVAGLPPAIANVRVTLRGIEHTDPDDIDALLVGPGSRRVLVMSDACAGSPLTGQTLMFDATGSALPASGSCPPAVYAASNYGTPDPFTPPAPGAPYGSSLSEFRGAPANGTWQLFVTDDNPGGGVGEITAGWRLELLPELSCAGRPASVEDLVGGAGNDVITGTSGPDVIFGLGGDDTINGLGGTDVICGGDGNDRLFGGRGNDLMRGESGDDTLKGQKGKDKLKGGPGRDVCAGGPKRDVAKGCEKRKSI